MNGNILKEGAVLRKNNKITEKLEQDPIARTVRQSTTNVPLYPGPGSYKVKNPAKLLSLEAWRDF